ncbi:MAG: 4-(cytidine 5'-diphospho)-2-C-methyl-D-erythritol kinase [Oscillospiraceae bacterium]|nr:4-(cytidine 5'-diphospho)-2-C-methyl-D-erythritol kinase [Oscillospiraceae bacterium]
MELFERAGAKLNLSLDVLGKRPDGYHEMRMVMQSVCFGDDIIISKGRKGEISCSCSLGYLPTDGRNLAFSAASAFLNEIGRPDDGLHIHIEKRIPVCAGMAGGSSDAAAVLRCLNRAYDNILSADRLSKLGAGLGSDVPYCIFGGTALAEGRGEIVSPLPSLPPCHIVIAKPRISIRTPELFPKIDRRKSRLHPDTSGLIEALGTGDLKAVSMRLYNVFEDVLPRNAGEIFEYKSILSDSGALGCAMTGTGSAVFGLFDDKNKAEKAEKLLQNLTEQVYLSSPARTLLPYSLNSNEKE